MKIIRWILIAIFTVEGVTKLLALSFQVNFFAHWGYPAWFMYLIGLLELLGAIGLAKRKTRLYANKGLLVLMAGALFTHIKSGDAIQMMTLAILVTILLIVHLVKTKRGSSMSQTVTV